MLTKSQLARWTADLRANADKQGTSQLHRGDKFCCLGRLCHLMKDELGLKVETNEYGTTSYDHEELVLPNRLTDLCEIDRGGSLYKFLPGAKEYAHANSKFRFIPVDLARMNDGGWTFPQIADFLDKFYPAVDDPSPTTT